VKFYLLDTIYTYTGQCDDCARHQQWAETF